MVEFLSKLIVLMVNTHHCKNTHDEKIKLLAANCFPALKYRRILLRAIRGDSQQTPQNRRCDHTLSCSLRTIGCTQIPQSKPL